jgi:hypothetical protein
MMSGRVLALYSVALIGTRPVGGFVIGVVVDHGGPRLAFATSAAVVVFAVMTMALGSSSRARLSPRSFTKRSHRGPGGHGS